MRIKRLSNETGVIFVTVLMIILIAIVLTLSIVSMNTSNALLAERELRRVQMLLIAEGSINLLNSYQMLETPTTEINWSTTYASGRQFSTISGIYDLYGGVQYPITGSRSKSMIISTFTTN